MDEKSRKDRLHDMGIADPMDVLDEMDELDKGDEMYVTDEMDSLSALAKLGVVILWVVAGLVGLFGLSVE